MLVIQILAYQTIITETYENATDGHVLHLWSGGGKKSGVFWVIVFLFLVIFTSSVADAGEFGDSPSLSGGKVIPENGTWGSIFTYEVLFMDPENILPAEGPRVYIDGGVGRLMKEDDPADNNVVDGKLYKYEWKPSEENIKKSPFFDNFRVDDYTVDPGRRVTFSGYLFCDYSFYFSHVKNGSENARDPITGTYSARVALSGRRIDLIEENSVVKSDNTDENGYFSISIDAPSSGSYAYAVSFAGDDHFNSSRSYVEPVITFNTLSVSAFFCIFSVVVVLFLAFLLSRGIRRSQYLRPVLIGFALAMFLAFLLGAGFIGLIVAGAVTGYLYAREVKGWSRHLRAGGLVALFLVLVSCFEIAALIKRMAADYVVSLGRSISNTELLAGLFFNVLFSAFIIILWVGLGASLGGYLRKSLKPKEETEKPGSGVGQVAGG